MFMYWWFEMESVDIHGGLVLLLLPEPGLGEGCALAQTWWSPPSALVQTLGVYPDQALLT